MRIWSLHPRCLDRTGLVACWRESLLAQKVLQGLTLGYRYHPQLIRFRSQPDPLAAIASYLTGLACDAVRRGYQFDRSKIIAVPTAEKIPVTRGQILYEYAHLLEKLRYRDPERYTRLLTMEMPEVHPSFRMVEGPEEPWEKGRSHL